MFRLIRRIFRSWGLKGRNYESTSFILKTSPHLLLNISHLVEISFESIRDGRVGGVGTEELTEEKRVTGAFTGKIALEASKHASEARKIDRKAIAKGRFRRFVAAMRGLHFGGRRG